MIERLGVEMSDSADDRPDGGPPGTLERPPHRAQHASAEAAEACPLCAIAEIRDVMRELKPLLEVIHRSPWLRRMGGF
jgi:hypothetical protein